MKKQNIFLGIILILLFFIYFYLFNYVKIMKHAAYVGYDLTNFKKLEKQITDLEVDMDKKIEAKINEKLKKGGNNE